MAKTTETKKENKIESLLPKPGEALKVVKSSSFSNRSETVSGIHVGKKGKDFSFKTKK